MCIEISCLKNTSKKTLWKNLNEKLVLIAKKNMLLLHY